jgi:hypothetical protein
MKSENGNLIGGREISFVEEWSLRTGDEVLERPLQEVNVLSPSHCRDKQLGCGRLEFRCNVVVGLGLRAATLK